MNPPGDPANVGVHSRIGQSVADTQYRTGRVIADSRKGNKGLIALWKNSSVMGKHRPRGLENISGPAVVS